ncbi:MAG: choice-of-anchor D domain-containing protein [Dokdonella sp.]
MPHFLLAMAVAAAPFLATTAHAALGVCDASPADNVEVEATAGTPGPTSYNTLGAAFAAINAGTHQGSIAIEVCGNPTEAASAVLNASGVGASVYTAISIKPVGGVARAITGAIAAGSPLIDFAGASNVTVDGLNAGGNSLTISNTTAAATAGTSTIRFINGASLNTVTNTSVLGSSNATTATAAGNILFSTSTVAGGNSGNSISANNIGPAGAALMTKGVVAAGTAANPNANNVIDGNNIFDYFSATVSSSGVSVQANNNNWTISNNRFYQTAARTFTATALRYAGITLNASSGAFTVTGNKIGFGAADGSGTTTISGSTNTFRGIDAASTSTTVVTSIQGNTISGISQTTASTGTGTSTQFIGMMLGSTDGLFNAGNVTGNSIGSLDGSSTIVVNVTAGAGTVDGIYNFSNFSTNISNNNIGAITIQGSGSTAGFRGILINTGSGAAAVATVTNNTIGGAGAGAITDSLVGSYAMYAIQTALPPVVVTGNVISNFIGNSNGAVVAMSGLQIGAGTTTVANTISRNTFHSLSNAAGAAAGAVYAIDLTLPVTANIVERNYVRSISATSTANGYQIIGIIARAQGTATYKNNMISLGLDALGNSITSPFSIVGIRDSTGTTSANNYYFNSVYIGGTGVLAGTGASNSLAMNSDVVTNVRNFQNNIFWNARSNAVAGGVAHIAIRAGGTAPNPAGLTSSSNDLLATGTDGFVGLFNSVLDLTLNDWRIATGVDLNSLALDPLFVSTTNLHVASASPMFAAGTTIAGITDDFDGDVRPATPTIGADEPPPPVGIVSISPLSHDFGNQAIGTTSAASSITISNTGTGSFDVTGLTAAVAPFAQSGGSCTAVPFTLAAGTNCTLDYTFSPTVAGVANQAFTVTATAAGDTGFALSGTGTANAPTIAKSFTPSSVATATNSTVTITLSNSNASAITLTANLVDTLPAGLVASAASTTCTGTSSFTAGSLTLASGATIPASGSCTLTGTVQAATAGSYVNTIAAGDLQTNAGNNAAAATDTLTVTAVTRTVTSSVGTPSGNITPLGAQIVADGASQAFTLTPTVGFHIATTTGTCPGVLAGNVYTAGPITFDCSVIANFAADVIPGTFPPDENFDEVTAPAMPGGWVSAHTGAGIDWVTTTTASDTAPNAAYAAEFGAVADETLDSPTFTAVAGQTLTFRHSYNLEVSLTAPTTYDGAVLEISINGGAFQDIVAAGGSFVSGGYNKVVSSSFSSPLAGRPAWGGSSAGFITTIVALPAAAVGQPAILRFRTGDDSSAVATAPNGWWIDTLHLGVFNPPSATVTPASLSFTAPTNGTDAHTLTIANAAGSSPLTYAITTLASRPVLRPHVQGLSKAVRPAQLTAKDLIDQANRQQPSLAGVSSTSVRVASPWVPATAVLFQLDDGSVEGAVGWGVVGPPATESGAVWINQFSATGPLTVDSVSILWRTPTTGTFVGLQPNLVVYYDAASTGDPSNATRVGVDTLVTIATQGAFETYPTNFFIPGAGDVYIGFVDQWALAGGFTPRLFPGAQDRTSSAHSSWLSAAGTPPTDITTLANNSTTGIIDDLSAALAGNWMIRATGTAGAAVCTGAVVPWLTAAPSSGSVNGGASAPVTVTANPAAGSLVEGTYTAEVCITTNDPANALIAVPVTLTVTTPPFVPCSSGADQVFCDGFDGSATNPNVVTGVINQPAVGDPNGSSFDFALGDFHAYDSGITADDINLYSNAAPAINVYWYGDAVPVAFQGLVGGVVTTPGGTDFTVLHSGDVIGPSSSVSAASTGADMSAFEAGVNGYIGVAFYNEGTAALNFGYLHVTTTAGGFPIQVLDYGFDNSGAAITIP